VRTYVRNDDYRTAATIWRDTVTKRPLNARARVNLGVYLTIDRNLPGADERTDEAIRHYREALLLMPDLAEAHGELAIALAGQGRTDEAVRHYREAIQIRPDYPEAHYNLANALLRVGQMDKAVRHYREALRLKPDYAEAHSNLAIALGSQGQMDEALRHCREALRIKPDFAEAHCNLAVALTMLGRTDEAITHYRQAVRANPDLVQALRNLAWIMATDSDPKRRNGPEALRLAEHGCRLTGRKDPALLDALAAAYAEAGRFQEAAAAAREAEALAWSLGNRQLSAQIQARLRVYEAGRPYHVGATP
jgi:tetratricopeptide (TPR) repeat protein